MTEATEDECNAAVTRCTLAARAMLDLNLPGVMAEQQRYDAFGPFVDPTGWMIDRKRSNDCRELLEAARPLWEWAQKQKRSLSND